MGSGQWRGIFDEHNGLNKGMEVVLRKVCSLVTVGGLDGFLEKTIRDSSHELENSGPLPSLRLRYLICKMGEMMVFTMDGGEALTR